MKITADDLKKLGVIEKIIPEYGGADSKSVDAIAGFMKENIKQFLKQFDGVGQEEIAKKRYQRLRNM